MQPKTDATILMIRRSTYTMVAAPVALRTTFISEHLAESKKYFEVIFEIHWQQKIRNFYTKIFDINKQKIVIWRYENVRNAL